MLVIPVTHTRAETTHQDEYLMIYVKMHDSETLEKQGDFAGALAGFKDCYQRLNKIHQKDPQWESALVIHRMEDCKTMIEKLQNMVGPGTPPPTPQPVVPAIPATPSPSAPPSTQSSAVDPGSYPDDVPSLKKRLAAVEQELRVTKDALRNSQNDVEAYRSQLQTVNQQLQALKSKQSVDDKVARLLSENKALTDKLVTAQKQLDDLKAPNPKSKLAMMQTQLKNLQDQFDESQAANKALQQTISTLQQNLEAAQAQIANDNQRLAALGPNNPEYATIKRENEVMRAILTRELQEQAHRDMAKRLYQEEYDNLKIKSKVLQEQLDILASPMTPASSDEERALLASLKAPGPQVAPPPPDANGNSLSASNTTPASTDTNAASATPPAPTTTGTDTTAAATPPATTDTNTASATPPAPTTTGTDTTAAATPPVTTDTNTASTTPPASTSTGTDTTSVSAPLASTDTNTASATPPAAPDNSTPAAPPATTTVASSDPPTVSHLPPPTTTYIDTSIKRAPENKSDPTQYSTKPRLPDDMLDVAQQAADLFKNKRYDEAAAKYQTIIDKYPESLYAWSNLGVVRFQQGDLDDALKALQQAVKLSPTDAFSYSNLGIVYYEMKQYENAIDALNAAKALDPNDAKTRNYLGCACSQKGWQEAAEKEFLKAIELDPSFGDAHFNLALVYATEKPPLLELARKEYRKAQDLGIPADPRLEKLLQQQPAQQSAAKQ